MSTKCRHCGSSSYGRSCIYGLLGLMAVGVLVLAGCAGNGTWNQRDEVERARFSAERSMLH